MTINMSAQTFRELAKKALVKDGMSESEAETKVNKYLKSKGVE